MLFEALSLRIVFSENLAEIERRSQTAQKQGKTECCRSGLCCWRRPGALAPEDVPAIAAHLGITEQELFKQFLVVDRFSDLSLVPRRKHQEGGVFLPWQETYSLETPCVFLDTENGNACSIHPVKPHDCKRFRCWVNESNEVTEMPREKLIELGWGGDEDVA